MVTIADKDIMLDEIVLQLNDGKKLDLVPANTCLWGTCSPAATCPES
jgi:hypothetical protein